MLELADHQFIVPSLFLYEYTSTISRMHHQKALVEDEAPTTVSTLPLPNPLTVRCGQQT
jgi:hypothetical protein